MRDNIINDMKNNIRALKRIEEDHNLNTNIKTHADVHYNENIDGHGEGDTISKKKTSEIMKTNFKSEYLLPKNEKNITASTALTNNNNSTVVISNLKNSFILNNNPSSSPSSPSPSSPPPPSPPFLIQDLFNTNKLIIPAKYYEETSFSKIVIGLWHYRLKRTAIVWTKWYVSLTLPFNYHHLHHPF